MRNKRAISNSGVIWVVSGLALITYALLGLTGAAIPGIEQLVAFVQGANGWYIYPAVFVAIFIEGLYVVGSIFPGTSIVLLTAIVAQSGGWSTFFGVLIAIFLGWNLAGVVNVLLSKVFAPTKSTAPQSSVVEYPEITWFPAFRANTEVAEVAEGKSITRVLRTSLRVKALTSLALAVYASIIPFIVDINQLSNTEGFWGLLLIATVSILVGGQKIYTDRTHQ
jgi:hypothetical protein